MEINSVAEKERKNTQWKTDRATTRNNFGGRRIN